MAVREACVEITKDRAGGKDLVDAVSLGPICLNAFPLPEEPDTPAYPLTLAYSPQSQLVQLRHTVDPELMFRDYWYNSGTNESMAMHLSHVVRDAMQYTILKPDDMVVDIGCNDGTLLACYPDWVRKVGYDPAKDVNPVCDLFINDFFRPDPNVRNAKIVTSIAMFYDIDDPVAFATQVRNIMADDGIWVIEMHYLPMMLQNNEVDAICHEHLCYYSLTSLSYVLRQAGMSVVDVSFNQVNGGSMRAIVKKAGRATSPSPMMQNTIAKEAKVSLQEELKAFAARIETNKYLLNGLLYQISRSDGRVYGYGASTKGNTLLQYYGIDWDLIDAIADRNPKKFGRETVGMRIPIISEELMRDGEPTHLLALPYHFIDTFRKREDPKYKWIVPVPVPQVLT